MRPSTWSDSRLRRLETALDQVSRREITRADFRAVWSLDIDAARARVARWRAGEARVCRKRPWHTDEGEPRAGVLEWRRRRHVRMVALAEGVTKLVRFLTESRL
jgi:hypothetical protein